MSRTDGAVWFEVRQANEQVADILERLAYQTTGLQELLGHGFGFKVEISSEDAEVLRRYFLE